MISNTMLSLELSSWISTPALAESHPARDHVLPPKLTISFITCMYVRKAIASTTPDIVMSERKKRRLFQPS